MNKIYVSLCKLLKERGIESESGVRVWTNFPYESFHYTKYEISDILRKDTLVKLWGTVCPECNREHMLEKYWEIHRQKILLIWDSEDSKPLEDCPKVIDYLIENIKP